MKHIIMLILIMTIVGCTDAPKTNSLEKPDKSIHEAAFFGDLKSINAHMASGTDLNQKDAYGSTPLNIAITFNKEAVALALIEGGADLAITAADGSTPLHTAVFFGRTTIVQALIDQEVDQTVTNTYGATALQSAQVPLNELKPIYDQISKDLGPLGFKIDYQELAENRKKIVLLLQQ